MERDEPRASAEQALATQSKTFQQNQDGITQRLAQAEQTNAQMQGEMNLVSDKLKLTEDQLASARTQVKQTAPTTPRNSPTWTINAGDQGQRR